jgi:nucleotide-binding universal stress UspA family protein
MVVRMNHTLFSPKRLLDYALGSVSSAITQHAPCPVLVVRGLREQVEEPEDVTPVPAT